MTNSPTSNAQPSPRLIRAACHFKDAIIGAFYDGMAHRPDSTFGTVNDDVLAFKDPAFKRTDFCQVILGSAWAH